MQKTQRLIGVGTVPTVNNEKIRVGDSIVYNYGQIYKVLSVIKKTAKGRILKVRSPAGKTYESRFLNRGNSTLANMSNPKRIQFIKR